MQWLKNDRILSLLFRVQWFVFAIGCVKGCSKHVSSAVAAARYCNLTPCRFHPFPKHLNYFELTVWHTRCIVKTGGFTRGVCKNRGFYIKFKGFPCGIPREQAILRKAKSPRKSPEKWSFLSLAFTMHLVCTLLIERHFGASKIALTKARLLKHDLPVHGGCRKRFPMFAQAVLEGVPPTGLSRDRKKGSLRKGSFHWRNL